MTNLNQREKMLIACLKQKLGTHMAFFLLLCFFSIEGKEVEYLVPKILKIHPHDPSAFTQGLAIKDDLLYESTGLYGSSGLKRISLQTHEILEHVHVPSSFFAEGIAIIGHLLFQLTWKEHQAFVYDLRTLQLVGTRTYQGEGWGICSDGQHLFISNGTSWITVRDPFTFKIIHHYQVRQGKKIIDRLNDLECVGQFIYANRWGKETIIRFDKKTGEITGVIDASGLLTEEEKMSAGPEGVLNGIAYDREKKHFFITGKRWPWLFEVLFVPITHK